MSLTDVQLRDAAQNLRVVRIKDGKELEAYAVLWNPKTRDVAAVDDEDLGEGFIVAIGVKE